MSATTSSTPGRYGGALRGRRLPAVEERSAGGVVIDVHEGAARTAVIARRNRAGRVEWCLPKGHIEPGETLTQTAEREVAEENGGKEERVTRQQREQSPRGLLAGGRGALRG